MAAPTSGPCGPWIEPEAVLACCAGLTDPPNQLMLTKAITFATSILFRLSGRQFQGECPRTVRPCYADGFGCGIQDWAQWPMGGWSIFAWDQAAQGWSFPAVPFLIDGQWFNMATGGGCAGRCDLPAVTLPAPVSGVTEVVIDGEIFPQTDPDTGALNWAVQEYRQLVRLDGHNWPCTQNRRADSAPYGADPNDGSKDGTWQVTYTFGRGPGEDGETACARYSCEIAKFLCNAAECNLPQRVKTINREGVMLDMLDPMTFIEDGKTGVDLVDIWLFSVNPSRLQRRATVRRLDGPRQYRGFT